MTNLCNVNGRALPEAEATVPVLDRGFLFGDSVYEVIRTRLGVPFAFPEHLGRLHASADGIRLALDLDDGRIMGRIKSTLQATGLPDAYIRIVVTRGTGTAPNISLTHAPGPPNWVIFVRELPAVQNRPAKLAIVPRLRMDRRALDPAIKSGNYLNNVLGLAEAVSEGATDCLFLNAEGNVTEASTANFFAVFGNRLVTPPLSAGLLKGITRSLLQRFAAEVGMEFVERDLSEAEVRSADELFLSSTLRDIAPVTHLDGQPLHGGRPGPVTSRLMQQFDDYCQRLVREVYKPAWEKIRPE